MASQRQKKFPLWAGYAEHAPTLSMWRMIVMRRILALALAPIVLLAGCGNGGDANAAAPSAEGGDAAVTAPAPGRDWTTVVRRTEAGGYMVGNPNAAVKLVEYGSRTCPACAAFDMTGKPALLNTYVRTGRVSYEFRDFLIHPMDLGVALLGRCVSADRFFPMLDQMFVNQRTLLSGASSIPQATIARIQAMPPQQAAAAWAEMLGYLDFVKQRGVSETRARQCLANANETEVLVQILRTAVNEGVSGTPTFFINGRKVENVSGWAQLEPALRAAGAR